MDITAIITIGRDGRQPIVPPLSDYDSASPGWVEAEFPCVELAARHVRVGFWTGEPGEVALHPWPYTEVCCIVSGLVAIVDRRGGRRDFRPLDSFVIPKGFVGSWLTLLPSSKTFLAID